MLALRSRHLQRSRRGQLQQLCSRYNQCSKCNAVLALCCWHLQRSRGRQLQRLSPGPHQHSTWQRILP
jgi:hypothetical protein